MVNKNETILINKKNNKTFMILAFFGIIFVVSSHFGCGINLFYDIFPYGSFYMPLFIFISGYFYKIKNEDNIIVYLKKKIKSLIIPFLLWNLFYGILVSILRYKNIVNYGKPINLHTVFIEPFIRNEQFTLNFPSWFVPALFFTSIVYVLLRKILSKVKIWNDYIMIVLFVVLGAVCVYNQDLAKFKDYKVILLRTGFFMQFYHLAYVYKSKLEKYDNKINNYIYFIMLIAINVCLIYKFKKISYNAHAFCDFNRTLFILPFITSMTGILFWIRISKILEKSLGESKLVNYISNNTFDIMVNHAFWSLGLNIILYKTRSIIRIVKFTV